MVVLLLNGCASVAVFDNTRNLNIVSWQQDTIRGDLALHLEWSKPARAGSFPTIVVHPGVHNDATALKSVVEDLARRGYVAVAIDYRRKTQKGFQRVMFPWHDEHDIELVMQTILAEPAVHPDAIATVGFSLGAAHSFLLAAHQKTIKTVVAYYPMTDLPSWVISRERRFFWRLALKAVRSSFNVEHGPNGDDLHRQLLTWYSAFYRTPQLDVPVLVIHGEQDRIAPVEHSKKFVSLLNEQHQDTADLVLIENRGHAFDSHPDNANSTSRAALLDWLAQHFPARPGRDESRLESAALAIERPARP